MEDKITQVKSWLGSGSINIFGIQFSGKDTLGVALAEKLGAEFISSGDLIRAAARDDSADERIRQAAIDSQTGVLTPTDEFRELIIPYLKQDKLTGKSLVLGSVGRWIGEEEPVMEALAAGGHDLKVVIVMNIPEAEVWKRWENVKDTRNGGREDDLTRERIQKRLDEFAEKTLPVIDKYRQMGYVIDVDATGSIEETFALAIDLLYNKTRLHDVAL